jgi:hypothetical protein
MQKYKHDYHFGHQNTHGEHDYINEIDTKNLLLYSIAVDVLNLFKEQNSPSILILFTLISSKLR